MKSKSILEKYSPKLNKWFTNEIVYEGKGIALFSDLVGSIEGKTIIVISELGDLKITMEYEKLNSDVQIIGKSESSRILSFLYRQPKQKYVAIGEKNKSHCSKLTVKTQDGIFTSTSNIYWTSGDLKDELVFWISRGEFEITTRNKPKYWVMPLTNFIAAFHYNSNPNLIQHPLRVYSAPIVPEMEDKQQRGEAFFVANSKNNLISFSFETKTGFIEPLPDFNERKKKLEDGKDHQRMTALMIGEVTSNVDSDWFPYEYANLLSFSSGSEVGVSWLEYRDKNGNLIKRKHFPIHKTTYNKGYAIVEEIHGGLGRLISLASISPEFHKTYFRILTTHLAQLISQNHLENRMTILIRAFEGLFETKGDELSAGNKNLMMNLPDSYKSEIRSILKKASNEIEKLRRQSRKDSLPEETRYSLERIKKKLENANNTDGDFGMKILNLLELYKMPDAKVMENIYLVLARKEARSWTGSLSKMRNDTIHFGYFALQDGTYDWDEIINTQDHLHDILVRIVLKTLNYKDEYQPKVIDGWVDGKTIDWINENTSAKELGYERRRLV